MSFTVFNEATGAWDNTSEDLQRGIVYMDNRYIEYGCFPRDYKNNILVGVRDARLKMQPTIAISKEVCKDLVYSNRIGAYIRAKDMDDYSLYKEIHLMGQGEFPYSFNRNYEAADNADLFKGKQEVLHNDVYKLSNYLDFTFGLEFETSMGYIPQEICFRDGLIPLRDGSISGLEYSTVVLKGNKGLNLLKQQIETLKKYTFFNKECALHIHLGGFPVNPKVIFILNELWYAVERLLCDKYVPSFTFNTAKYKKNGKDYCKFVRDYSNFEDMYYDLIGIPYLGSLYQPHPNDIEKRAKWNIKSRYASLNFINMLCYKGPKTVEFRFLRPTYNFNKILLWLYILNAVLKYAIMWDKHHPDASWMDIRGRFIGDRVSLVNILSAVYNSSDVFQWIMDQLVKLETAVILQTWNEDYCGKDTYLEDILFDECS
jgi:hypothetical protein